MNREPISYYFKNPSKLVDISIKQIEKWLQESPYSQPLRTLLAKRIHLDQELVLDSSIAHASALSSNRSWLFRQLSNPAEEAQICAPSNDTKESSNENLYIADDRSKSEEITIPSDTQLPENANINEELLENESLDALVDSKEIEADESTEENLIIEYTEIELSKTLNEDTQEVENEEFNDAQNHTEDRSNITIKNTETVLDPIANIAPAELKSIESNLDTVENTTKSIVLKDSILMDGNKSIHEIEVVRVNTNEEFVKGKKSEKGKETKKKKKRKATSKKKIKAKSKKSRKTKKYKEHEVILDIENRTSKLAKDKNKKKKSIKKKEKPNLKLLKYNIPVSPSQEKANEFDQDYNDMSNYTQWLLQFSKNKEISSFDNMTIARKDNSSIELSSSSSTTKKNKSKSKKKKKKTVTSKSGKGRSSKKTDLSLESNEEIISELWADLLAKQGHIKKARKMYLKLSLKYPEKSSYFAAKLDNL